MNSLEKSVSETCIALLCNYCWVFLHKRGTKDKNFKSFTFHFSSNFNDFFWQNGHLNGSLMGYKTNYNFISKRGHNSEISHNWKKYIIFIFSHNFYKY